MEGGISFLAADYDLLYRWLCRWMERSGECCAAVLLACVPDGFVRLGVYPKRRTLYHGVRARGLWWDVACERRLIEPGI